MIARATMVASAIPSLRYVVTHVRCIQDHLTTQAAFLHTARRFVAQGIRVPENRCNVFMSCLLSADREDASGRVFPWRDAIVRSSS